MGVLGCARKPLSRLGNPAPCQQLLSKSGLKRLPAQLLVRRSIDAEGGPLISSLISAAEQAAVDATCRKLHQFLTRANAVERLKVTHKFR